MWWNFLYIFASIQVNLYPAFKLIFIKSLAKFAFFCLQLLIFCLVLVCLVKMVNTSFKDVVMKNPSDEVSLSGLTRNPNIAIPSSETSKDCLNVVTLDPPGPSSFPEAIILDDSPQLQQDIVDLSQSCLVGNMLGEPVDMRTIISRTREDWNFCKGDVEYLNMGIHWVLIRFANPGDLYLVWSERP